MSTAENRRKAEYVEILRELKRDDPEAARVIEAHVTDLKREAQRLRKARRE